MSARRTRYAMYVLLPVLILLAALVYRHHLRQAQVVHGDVAVRFGMLPYGDHTYAIIGEKLGWFHEVGIALDYRTVKVEDTVPFLRNGSLDVGSCSPGVLFAAYDPKRPIVSFVFGDIFEGYAIMAQPGGGYRSVQEFVQSGMTLQQAVLSAAQQLRGKTFAYPTEAAIKPFITLALAKGGLTGADYKPLVLDDPLTVNAMRNHEADFQVGGVPSRLVLEREGFKPILTSNDLAATAKASPNSEELASIFTDGWATTREYYDSHPEVILRLASVNFRIMDYIRQNPDAALAIHMPYLSQVTGQTFTAAEGRVIYNSLDPFFTFDEQRVWYHDPGSPYYFANLNGAILNSFVKQGIYKSVSQPKVSDVIAADEVYERLESLRAKTDEELKEIASSGAPSDTITSEVAKARHSYEIYDYYDAERAAAGVLKMLGKQRP